MFEVGDKIIKKDLDTFYDNKTFEVTKVFIDHLYITSINHKDVILYVCQDNWMLDVDYYRRKKLEKLCSKLGI